MREYPLLAALFLTASASVLADGGETPPNPPSEAAQPDTSQRHCLLETGSRIPHRHDECLPVHGTSYGRAELESGGATSLGESLWRLDPAIQLSGRR